MEENSRRPGPNKRAHKAQLSSRSKSPPTLPPPPTSRELGRFTRATETRECSVGCSGQSCRSCSAALVADCVALCCCPFAFVSLLGLAFVKVPCAMGKRLLGRRERKEKEKRKVCFSSRKESVGVRSEKSCMGNEEDSGVKSESEKSRATSLEFGEIEGEIVGNRSLCAEVIEVDNVLLEMCQVGHLGFGRVSCSGAHPNDMGH